MKFKLTTAQAWTVHSLEVLVFSACFSFIVTCYAAFQNGTFDLQRTTIAAASLALALLGNGVKGMINNANFAQSLEDFYKEITDRQPAAQAVSPVTVHVNNPAPTTPTPTTPAAQQFAPLSRNFTGLELPTVQPTVVSTPAQ